MELVQISVELDDTPVAPFDGEETEGVPGVGQTLVTEREPDHEETIEL